MTSARPPEAGGDTAAAYASDRCVHDLFEQQVERTPDAVAVEYEDERLTYAELNTRANRLAHHLRSSGLGVGPEVLVGLCVERSIEMVVGLLGILKAGGAYVPIDPGYPADRIAFILRDARISVVLTQAALVERLPELSAVVVRLDEDVALWRSLPDKNPERLATADNAMYVIYTSGTTGRPKGAVIEGRGVVNLFSGALVRDRYRGPCRVLHRASFAFDVSVLELLGPLLFGGCVVMCPRGAHVDPDALASLVRRRRITYIDVPPSLLVYLLEQPDFCQAESLRLVSVGGERLDEALVAAFEEKARAELWNAYGPTEATVEATSWRALPRDEPGRVYIGRPHPRYRVYVLDRSGRPAPAGVEGELSIGGVGLARGYLNRPDLTAERFVPDPFSESPGDRMYRTGDLARWSERGELEFLGRADHQVKIRGFRVELGEIEAALSAHASVREAVVVAREDAPGDKRLVAYLVLSDVSDVSDGEGAPSALREHLRAMLPEPMLPSAFVVLKSLPLTPNGKIDRKALPAPDGARSADGASYEPPRTETEQALAAVWEELLCVRPVGVTDDFFSLGGHSLLAMRLINTVRARLGFSLSMASLFSHPTVRALASLVERPPERSQPAADIRLLPRPPGEPAYEGLSGTERRLWFLERLFSQARSYQVPEVFRVTGALDLGALKASLRALAGRHEALRTSYPKINGAPARAVSPDETISLRWEDLTELPAPAREAALRALLATEVATPFDLERGPLARALVVREAEEEHVLMLHLHHILTDEWSAGVLLREWSALYDAARRGKAAALPPLLYQYADYARAEQRAFEDGGLAASRAYWKAQLAGLPRLSLPFVRPSPEAGPGPEGHVSCRVPLSTSRALHALARANGCTLFMAYYAAVAAVLSRSSGQADFGLGAAMANREVAGTENILGFFTNTVVLRADLAGDPTFLELLGRAKRTAVDAYRHQALPFDVVVQDQHVARRAGETPFYDVSFIEVTALEGGAAGWSPLFEGTLGDGAASAKDPLGIAVSHSREGTSLRIMYDTSRVERAAVERMAGHLLTLLGDAAAHPETRISRLALLTDAEKELFAAWNDTASAYPSHLCPHELFEQQASITPDAIAVEHEDARLTYAELNREANRLAHHLRRLGVGPEVRVGLCVERSLSMIVGLLGILKAGGAYVPLDPSYPNERLAFMLDDARASVLLTQAALEDRLPAHNAAVVRLDADAAQWAREPETKPDSGVGPDHAMYVIYTSGTTGRPKGAMNEHRGLTARVAYQRSTFPIDPKDRILQHASVAFDGALNDWLCALCNGATLVLMGKRAMISEALESRGITVAFVPPALLASLSCRAPSLRLILLAGDTTPPEAAKRWAAGRKILHLYGPTEFSIHGAGRYYDPETPDTLPIGRPIQNVRVHLLDGSGNQVPVGVTGEIYLAGVGLSRGYLNRPDLTAERFVPDPFSESPGARMYRTGDLARWSEQGELEFLGRADHQVKIRGFRVELGEIEAALSSHASVRETVVVAREDAPGDKRLVAYVVPNKESVASESAPQLGAEQVSAWRTFFDGAPPPTEDRADPLFNISGWNSSYTQRPIPAEQMREWRDRTVERIVALKPRRVWEIGCGAGLILLPLAPLCEEYLGTDFSASALDGLQKAVLSLGLRNVRLEQREAARCDGIPERHFDVIILNSIVQYFPDADYLRQVLEGAARALSPGGVIFLGDVRNHDLLEAFHVSVQRHRRREDLSAADLSDVRRAIRKEEELLIAPAVLRWLCAQIEGLSHAEISLKRGRGDNEMNRYRYDAVLYSDPAPPPVQIEATRVWSAAHDTVNGLEQWLQKHRPAAAEVLGVPNARIYRDVVESRRLCGSEEMSSGRAALETVIDPESLWMVGERLGYRVRLRWSEEHGPGAMDVLWERGDGDLPPGLWRSRRDVTGLVVGDHVSNPLRYTKERELVARLRSFLERKVPEYMRPSHILVLDTLPLTPNGKVDRGALPAPFLERRVAGYVAPRTPAEETLARIWAEVLDVDRVGVFDNFFTLGGDSILTIQVISKAQRAGMRFSMQQLFQHQTVAALATVAVPLTDSGAEQGPVSGPVALTPIQRWFFEQNLAEPHHYNQVALLSTRERLDAGALSRAVEHLVQHHDALRLRFAREGAEVRQVNAGVDATGMVAAVDLSAVPAADQAQAIEAAAADIQGSLRLETGPLMRVVMLDLGPERPSLLLIVIHHLAMDGVSWRILIEDLETAYVQARRGDSLRLPPKTTSFQQWSERLSAYAQSETVRRELPYWRALPPVAPLPADRAGGGNTVGSARTVAIELSADETRALLREVAEIYNTHINDVLLTALAQALAPWAGTPRISFDLEGHGREEIAPDLDLSRTVGWFTSIYPVTLELPDAPLGDVLKAVREQLRRVPQRGLGYGLLRYLQKDAAIRAELAARPGADLMFSYTGQLDQVVGASSLFQFTGESVGPDRSPRAARRYLLELNGEIVDERLQFEWTYSEEVHRRETIEGLAQRFVTALQAIVTHCRSLSPSERAAEEARVEQDQRATASCAVPLADGSRPGAVLLLPAVGGHLSANMIRLAHAIGGGRPVVGLTTPPHTGAGRMPRTLEALCAQYAREIVGRVAAGPLALVGYCYGGYPAIQLAADLEAAGREVQQVIMIESTAPWMPEEGPEEPFERRAALLRIARLWGLALDPAALRGLSEEQAIRRVVAALSAADRASTGAESTLRAILDTQEAHRQMLERWTPPVPKARAYLLRASDDSEHLPWDYAWGSHLALAGVYEIPGDHFGIVRADHLETTARAVAGLLSRSLPPQ
ncbi:MAG TPA: amino acid adenylation domain-containing protein [Polyangiaceae bacterium]|nr:amino acid adenylation domain-containing protein [Polyangiaceae bacterium]